LEVPQYIREIVEHMAFVARDDKKVDKRSGVSQRLPISVLENVISNAERRALRTGEAVAVPRVLDINSALPSITGKLELEYEGELKGGENVAKELIRMAVGKVYSSYFDGVNVSQITTWFDLGGTLKLDEDIPSSAMVEQLGHIQGLMEKTAALGLGKNEPDGVRASAAEFILEGLYAHRRVNRNEESGFTAGERKKDAPEREEGPSRKQRRQFN
jgi:magnesium chelatase subunit I